MVTRVFLHFMWFALSSHRLSMVKTFALMGCCCFGSFESQLKVAPLSSEIFNNFSFRVRVDVSFSTSQTNKKMKSRHWFKQIYRDNLGFTTVYSSRQCCKVDFSWVILHVVEQGLLRASCRDRYSKDQRKIFLYWQEIPLNLYLLAFITCAVCF